MTAQMIQTSVFLEEAKKTLEFHATRTPNASVYVTELVAGSCLDFVVSEGEDFKNKIDWFSSRRQGFLEREPLTKKELGKLERKYRLVEDSFSDKQWDQGYSVTVYGDGMYGLGPGSLSIVIDEGWTCGDKQKWPSIRMPFMRLKNNLDDATVPGQPLVGVFTPGTTPLEKLLSEPSEINRTWPRYGIAVHICASEAKDLGTIEIPNPRWDVLLKELAPNG